MKPFAIPPELKEELDRLVEQGYLNLTDEGKYSIGPEHFNAVTSWNADDIYWPLTALMRLQEHWWQENCEKE